MEKIRCDMFAYSIVTPYPATDSFKLYKEYGLVDDDYDTRKQIKYSGN